MKILIITQYFWPENFRINDLCLGLKERGHLVTILTGKPNYPSGKFYSGYSFWGKHLDSFNGIKIIRTPVIPRSKGKAFNLLLNYLSFAVTASLRLLFIKEKFDKIFVYMPSPVTVGIPGIVAKFKFKVKMYFWVQDLWPESIVAAGGVKNRLFIWLGEKLTHFVYTRCDIILVQSRMFIQYILKQNMPASKLVYFPNTAESYYKQCLPQKQYLEKFPNGFNLIFAGNIGEAQSFDTLLKAACILKKKIRVNWIIIGDGRMKEYVQKRIEDLHLENIFLLFGSLPSTEMPNYFCCADALVLSLKKDNIFSLTIPSKLQSYFACGRPVIGSINGEAANIIQEARAGFVAPAESYRDLATIIERMYNLSIIDRLKMGENARSYFEREFERDFLISKLEQIFLL